MPSDAQKAYRNKWDRANMKVIGCKVTREKADLFKQACDFLGTTMNAVLAQAIEETIKRAKGPE